MRGQAVRDAQESEEREGQGGRRPAEEVPGTRSVAAIQAPCHRVPEMHWVSHLLDNRLLSRLGGRRPGTVRSVPFGSQTATAPGTFAPTEVRESQAATRTPFRPGNRRPRCVS